jgi:hypothetical protein
MSAPNLYLSARTAAALVGLSSRQLRHYIATRAVPARLTPRGYLIRPQDLAQVVAGKRQGRGRPKK